MKKILLIGDSIRMGYDKYVKEALDGTAEVYYPSENCRFAAYTLRYAHEWKKKLELSDDVDLVHWNAGLWDVIEIMGDEPISTPEYYENVIKRIDKRLRVLFPKAKIIFATSKAVDQPKCTFRHNTIIKQYNDIAIEALSGTDTIINDLYKITVNCPPELHSDSVHYYTNGGTELIGGKVLAVICKELRISASEVNLENFSPENYDKDNIGY